MTDLTSTGTTTRGRSPLNYTTTPCEDYKMDGDYSNTLKERFYGSFNYTLINLYQQHCDRKTDHAFIRFLKVSYYTGGSLYGNNYFIVEQNLTKESNFIDISTIKQYINSLG